MQNRNLLVDYLKGLAIVLVVWGHSIQASTQNYDFFSNPVFIIIYSFHMPLFIFISGYLFYRSQGKKTFQALVVAKSKQILIPTLIWALIFMVNDYYLYNADAHRHPGLALTLRHYADTTTGALWFLWSLFISTIITACLSKLANDKAWLYPLALLLVCLLPNAEHFYFIKFVLPYFFGGYLYHRYKEQLVTAKKVAVYLSFLIYPLLLLVWRNEAFIYNGGETFTLLSLHGLAITVYRCLIGFMGIILFATVAKALTDNRDSALLKSLSKYSLGIFVISGLMTSFLSHRINLAHTSTLLYSFGYTPLIALVVIALALGIAVLISRNVFLNRYLLGGR